MEERDFRYKIEHMGDLFVEMLENVSLSLKRQFRGVSLTHDIHGIERKRKDIVYKIGERITVIRKAEPALFATDEPMTKLFAEFDEVAGTLDNLIKEREERLDRIRGKVNAVMDAVAASSTDEMTAEPA